MNDFLKLVKKTSVEAVNASKPADVVFGKVISATPLMIRVDQKLILNSAQLVLSRNVTDYRLSVTLDLETDSEPADQEGENEVPVEYSHIHKTSGENTMVVHNALTVGEDVILAQTAGGQKYIVLDRIGKG